MNNLNYPAFFNSVENILLQDPLSELLGTFENGQVEFSYPEIAKAAGHSCPTVAGAYLITQKALKALYRNEIPRRGSIRILFKQQRLEGVTGVIARVMSNITGATESDGFKGLNGKFSRTNLMEFEQDIPGIARFIRTDTNEKVDVFYNPNIVPHLPEMEKIMGKVMSGTASANEIELFGRLWQKRVEMILIDNKDNEDLISAHVA